MFDVRVLRFINLFNATSIIVDHQLINFKLLSPLLTYCVTLAVSLPMTVKSFANISLKF